MRGPLGWRLGAEETGQGVGVRDVYRRKTNLEGSGKHQEEARKRAQRVTCLELSTSGDGVLGNTVRRKGFGRREGNRLEEKEESIAGSGSASVSKLRSGVLNPR